MSQAHAESDLQQLVEGYCVRMFAVLMSGVMGSLWDYKTRITVQQDPSLTASVNTVVVLEQILDQVLPLLQVGKKEDEFQHSLPSNSTKVMQQLIDFNGESDQKEMLDTAITVTTRTASTTSLVTVSPSITGSISSKQSQIVKQGWLEKSGQFSFSRSKTRRFTLLDSGHFYFEKNDDKVPIDLANVNAITKSGSSDLIVSTTERVWTFKCKTQNERDEWFHSLSTVQSITFTTECEDCK
ncbi:hypothetical protein RFI_14735 [Reticulomyxa filosa]|uniref:PH domain-containing protein n=1 Tax=Reticulomyxa filosa TaxID=46433 RepID=X6N9Q1_RETFI|nr:hypothetical protein RFI_14735 [Reticulomyxa filosa]|eukprot:ETO22464.1 hypothetical protein RFI_14735 [Reticulomyxa filosa]